MTDPALFAAPDSPVVVVGGSLAGMAVAARLAYRGHHVQLFERTTQLGGHYRRTGLPPVIDLPAVWRDLFMKSGRALDPVLATHDLQWTAVPNVRHRFADGTELDWPTNRGEQTQLITELWGSAPAQRWATLLDQWNTMWQALRTLGLETETTPAAWRAAQPTMFPTQFGKRAALADLTDYLQEPHLAALVSHVAWQHGQDPARLPAFHGYRLAAANIFGRWRLTGNATTNSSPNLLLDLLQDRLRQRKVEIRLESPIEQVAGNTVHSADGPIQARAVICAVSPTQWVSLTRAGHWRGAGRTLHRAARIPWADAPIVSTGTPSPHVELVDHHHRSIQWPAPDTHWSWATENPTASAGPAWRSAATWYALLGPRLGPHYVVGAHTRAGFGSTGELLSAALAAYAVHSDLTGEDIHPSNRNQPPRLRRRPAR